MLSKSAKSSRSLKSPSRIAENVLLRHYIKRSVGVYLNIYIRNVLLAFHTQQSNDLEFQLIALIAFPNECCFNCKSL